MAGKTQVPVEPTNVPPELISDPLPEAGDNWAGRVSVMVTGPVLT